MGHKRQNAKCPCGTGRKYKECCYSKGFHCLVDEEGNITRDVPMSSEVQELIPEIKRQFIQRHGRPPGPDDRLFEGVDLEAACREVSAAMREAKVDPAYVYAFERTGLLLTEENRHLMPMKDVEEFEAAMAETSRRTAARAIRRWTDTRANRLRTWATEAPKPTACCRRSSTCISSAPK